MKYIVDVQGFKSFNNQFLFKEMALIALEEDAILSVYLFQPPYDWKYLPVKHKSENRWLEYNYLGIPWSSGDIPYREVFSILRTTLKDAEKIYVKGFEKKRWLRNIIPNKITDNIEDFGCPSLKKLLGEPISCQHHRLCWKPMCTAQNVYLLKSWMLEYQKRSTDSDGIDEVDSDKLFSICTIRK